MFKQEFFVSDGNCIFKFQNSIWDFKRIQMDFQEIEVLGMRATTFVLNSLICGTKIQLCRKPISWKSIWTYLKSQMEFWNLKISSKFVKKNHIWKFLWISQSGARGWIHTHCTTPRAWSKFEIDFQTWHIFFRFISNFQNSIWDFK